MMSKIGEIFGDFKLPSTLIKSAQAFDAVMESQRFESVSLEDYAGTEALASHVQEYKIQQQIRQYFGKEGSNEPKIGGHPDFDHLEKGSSAQGYVTTLFVDIQGSTRLGVCYPPSLVYTIKNQVIKCAIECILAMDGHVHRIMGDAVLAFFRGGGDNARNSAIDAVNCASLLVEFVQGKVIPALQDNGLLSDLGIRVGVDYGSEESVLWAMYGYTGASEVTATSFHVDIAAKLQQSAPLNNVMLGQSLVELLGLHDHVLSVKTIGKGDLQISEPNVVPSYLDLSGDEVSYGQYVLKQNVYYSLLPIHNDTYPIKISTTIKKKSLQPSGDIYYNCSRSVAKNQGIDFKARFMYEGGSSDIQVKFRVENYGSEASLEKANGNHSTLVPARRNEQGWYFSHHWEGTSYTGLHYMFVSVEVDGVALYPEQRYAIYIGDRK
ncbi:adenylate/guanylate cyclase domain-containing protein [Pseudomonas cichorii]|uniref:adenylate/guanylate cyclase domain-containing protein n=1 Tax=Pseudomonas cichorii TaxID=36746 RepID=UPI0021AA7705|nr:adenylate/guanylate cyclase domain-containing protein [Pseudomonas cichorii]